MFLYVCFSPHRSSVRLTIRKIQFSPDVSKVVPVAETTFEFLMSEKPLHIKMSLPKEVRHVVGVGTTAAKTLTCPSDLTRHRPSTTENRFQ